VAWLILGPYGAGKRKRLARLLAGLDRQIIHLDPLQAETRRALASPEGIRELLDDQIGPRSLLLLDPLQAQPGSLEALRALVRRYPWLPVLGVSDLWPEPLRPFAAPWREPLVRLIPALPPSFEELRGRGEPSALPPGQGAATEEEETHLAWELHLRRGAYSCAWSHADHATVLSVQVLAALRQAAVCRPRPTRPRALEQLLLWCAHHCGELLNISRAARACGISHATAMRYLELLERLMLVVRVPPFHEGRGNELRVTPRLHFPDNGVLHALGAHPDPAGRRPPTLPRRTLLRNAVAAELLKLTCGRAHVLHWTIKDGSGLPFVCETLRVRLAVALPDDLLGIPALPRSLRAFIRHHAPTAACVVQGTQTRTVVHNGTPVTFLPPWRLGAWVRAACPELGAP
jgi:predicted AAA+ superfamily ATPase